MPAGDGGVRHDQLLQFFVFNTNETEPLRSVHEQFSNLARKIMELPSNAERTVALRKLLEARDCATRARSA